MCLVERPADVGTASRRTALIVNGRAVRDVGLTRAVETAYRTALTAGLRAAFATIGMPWNVWTSFTSSTSPKFVWASGPWMPGTPSFGSNASHTSGSL